MARIAVLFGGPSCEHEVSIASGKNVLKGLLETEHTPYTAFVDKQGLWHVRNSPIVTADKSATLLPLSEPAVNAVLGVAALLELDIDAVFIALHGTYGEDGTVQGLLEAAGIPYTGSKVAASALAMNKIWTKALLRKHEIPVPPDLIVQWNTKVSPQEHSTRIVRELGLPCVIKLPCSGSSFGIRLVEDAQRLEDAITEMLSSTSPLLAEKYIKGRELTCGVIQRSLAIDAQALPVTEIIPKISRFFDFEAKYTPGATDEITPAQVSESLAKRVQELALQTFRVVECSGMARIDFMISDEEDVFVIEANTIPGMTDTSLLQQQAAAANINLPELLDLLLYSPLMTSRQR